MSRDGTYKGKGDSIVTVPISPELHRRLRMHAASEGRTIKWIVTRLIEQHLASVDWLGQNGCEIDHRPGDSA